MLALLQTYAVPLVIAFLIGLATARWIQPRGPSKDGQS